MSVRKTVEVRYLVERGNFFLANSEPEQAEQRKGVSSMIELALFKADAYAGFSYLESAGIDHDGWNSAWEQHREEAGIKARDGILGWNNDSPRWEDFCQDDTRRVYGIRSVRCGL